MKLNRQPRVLIIYNSRIHNFDQHGVSIRGWFKNWEKTNLAQIYSGYEINETLFCDKIYKIQPNDRNFGYIFKYFRKKEIISNQLSNIINIGINKSNKFKSFFLKNIFYFIIDTGLWEIIFKIKVSKEMHAFITAFNPDIIYCQGYSISFSKLPLLISKKFKLPICFQTGDDWPRNLYSNSYLSFLIRPYVNKISNNLINDAKLCFANSEEMALTFEKRYNKCFQVIMMGDNINRYQDPVFKKNKRDHFEIIYTGNLGSGRTDSIDDIINVICKLNKEGQNILLKIFATTFPNDFIEKVKYNNYIILEESPNHDLLPNYLAEADILLIPESFSEIQSDSISLSISTKAHLYMYCKIPILVYAPSNTGISKYASKHKFGLVVNNRSSIELENSIKNLLFNDKIRENFVENGLITALNNHCEEKINFNFENLLKINCK